MVDKITTVPKSKVGAHIGRLDDEDILRLNRAVLVFLGLATSPGIKKARADWDDKALNWAGIFSALDCTHK